MLRSSGNASQDILSFQNKLKLADERYLQEKTRHDDQVKKNMEKERQLQAQVGYSHIMLEQRIIRIEGISRETKEEE